PGAATSRLLLDHGRNQLLRRGVRGAGRAPAVEQHAKIVRERRVLRRRAPHFHVAEQLGDDLPAALRIAFAAPGERLEDGLPSVRLPGHGAGDGLLRVAAVESRLEPGEGEREHDHHRDREWPALPGDAECRHRRETYPRFGEHRKAKSYFAFATRESRAARSFGRSISFGGWGTMPSR